MLTPRRPPSPRTVGPQPYLTPSRGKQDSFTKPSTRTFTDASPRLSAAAPTTPDAPFNLMEQQRFQVQKLAVGLHARRELIQDDALHRRQTQLRDDAIRRHQCQSRVDGLHQRPFSANPSGSPRVGGLLRDARAVPTQEVAGRFQPLSAAVTATRAAATERVASARHDGARRLGELEQGHAHLHAERTSKQAQLMGQADNLASRRNAADMQKARREQQEQQQQHADARTSASARQGEADLQRRIREKREKALQARTLAWQVQAHWDDKPVVGRWNEQLSSSRTYRKRATGGPAARQMDSLGLSPRAAPHTPRSGSGRA